MKNPTRDPRPAPFPVGTRLRCKRERTLRMQARDSEEMVTVCGPGIEVTVDETVQGRRGTGRFIDLKDGEEPFIDETRDGYSIYHVGGHGRCIFREDKKEWERITSCKETSDERKRT